MSEWKLFKIDNPKTYPDDEGWYYVTLNYKHPSSFIPSSTIKLSGIAYWICNDNNMLRLGEGFETLKNDIGSMMLSNNITEEIIAYKKIEFPEAISDDDLYILENEYEEMKQREFGELISNLNKMCGEEDDPFSVEEVVVSE